MYITITSELILVNQITSASITYIATVRNFDLVKLIHLVAHSDNKPPANEPHLLLTSAANRSQALSVCQRALAVS